MGKIKIYTKENCIQCEATTRHLERLGIIYEEIDAIDNIESLAKLGHLRAPVVLLEDGTNWSGYQPDKLDELIF